MSSLPERVEHERELLAAASQRGALAQLGTYFRLSGPGWIASAITLGGGSLASSLYLGVLGGFSLLWLQPFAMILGVIMLAAIGFVALSTGERPFRGINEHVSPVLGWGWALAVALANVIWCMPQFSLAHGVMSQNLMPRWFGDEGRIVQAASSRLELTPSQALLEIASNPVFADNGVHWDRLPLWFAANSHKLVLSLTILILATIVTWSYDRGGRGIRVYETLLKMIVGVIVLCFLGVVVVLSFSDEVFSWAEVFRGLIPDFGLINHPARSMLPLLDAIGPAGDPVRVFWEQRLVADQRDVMISAAATAVGINMTFMFPYTLLRKGWTKEFRGFAAFDLCGGLFVPYVLATGLVVIASAAAFHTALPSGFSSETSGGRNQMIVPNVDSEAFRQLPLHEQGKQKKNLGAYLAALDAREAAITENSVSPAEQRLAATLVRRDAMDLAQSLSPLTGKTVANYVFGLGVLAMVLSTISILMLISGFVYAEMLGFEPGGIAHKLGCLVAGVGGVLWPVVWTGQSQFFLAVVTSVFGFMLLPFAYVTFVLVMNSRSLLGADMPRGVGRFVWNVLMAVAAVTASAGAGYMIWVKAGWVGIVAVVMFVKLAILVAIHQWNERRRAEAAVP